MTKITEQTVKKLKPTSRITDELIEGFVARCLPSGKVSFGYQYTDRASGARRWMGIGLYGAVTVDEARAAAKRYAGEVAAHKNPAAELEAKVARSENTVDHVLDRFLELYVPQKKLRSAAGIASALARHVRPAIGKTCIYDLGRGDITRMLDRIEGDRMADITLAFVRKAFNWWATRDDKFNSPIVAGMARGVSEARDRVLTDEEVADIFRALDGAGDWPTCYPAYIRTLLLTACRRAEVADMHTREIVGDDWVIPAARYKTKREHIVPLTAAIRSSLPQGFGYLFSSDGGKTSFQGFSKAKRALDARIAELRKTEGRLPMQEWRLHDLRRTARTMMAAAGVSNDIGERVLGHVIAGVGGTYNRHAYRAEKMAALEALAAHVERVAKAAPAPAAGKLRVVTA